MKINFYFYFLLFQKTISTIKINFIDLETLFDVFEKNILLIVASSGNILGSIFNWYLGKKITIFQDRKWFPVSPEQLNKSQKYFQKYGLWSLLLAWVPVIGDPLTLLAGVLKVRFSIFFILVSISKISRYIFILYLVSFV